MQKACKAEKLSQWRHGISLFDMPSKSYAYTMPLGLDEKDVGNYDGHEFKRVKVGLI